MPELKQLPDAPVWLQIVASIELLTRKKATDSTTDSEIKEDSAMALGLLSSLKPEDIQYDLQSDPVLRDQALDLHKMAKSSSRYDSVANVALGLVLVLLFVGLVVGTKGGVIGAVDAIVPALGPFIYASVIPVLIGIVSSWKSQAILADQLYPKIIEMLSDPSSALSLAVAERRAYIEGREAAKEPVIADILAEKIPPYTVHSNEPITPARTNYNNPVNQTEQTPRKPEGSRPPRV